jgi:hypothetical protein
LTYVLPKENTNSKENTLVAMAGKWALPRVLGLKHGAKSGGSKNNNNNIFVRTSFNSVSP